MYNPENFSLILNKFNKSMCHVAFNKLLQAQRITWPRRSMNDTRNRLCPNFLFSKYEG